MAETALKKRYVAAAVIGNALEFYDFTTYAYFALQIGRTFFPSHDPFVSLMITLMTFGAGFIMRPVGGILIGRYADRAGRKPAMIWPRLGMTLAVYPAFLALTHWPSAFTLICATAILGLLTQSTGSVGLVAITESLPPHIRSTTTAGIYAVGVAVFGGTTQSIVAWLMHLSGSALAPAWFLTGTSSVALVATVLMRETAPRSRQFPK